MNEADTTIFGVSDRTERTIGGNRTKVRIMLDELQSKLASRATTGSTMDQKRLAQRDAENAANSLEISEWAAESLKLPGQAREAATDLWEAISDGQLLCRLFNNYFPGKAIKFHKERTVGCRLEGYSRKRERERESMLSRMQHPSCPVMNLYCCWLSSSL